MNGIHPHPHFDLHLHDDAELAAVLGSPLVERTTLHEWPLSCVQRLRTADGRSLIYKVQAEPTVEPLFYARARSPILVRARPLAPAALLLDEVAAPCLKARQPSEAETLRVGKAVLAQIAQIEGDLPALADLRTGAGWRAWMATALDDLTALVESGRFQQVDGALIAKLAQAVEADAVIAALTGQRGYVHHDLSGDNLFLLDDGMRVIDWQRPLRGPVALDLAQLLESLGYDPRPHVGEGIVQMMRLLRIAWLAACARRWFPAGAPDYDRQIAALAASSLQSSHGFSARHFDDPSASRLS